MCGLGSERGGSAAISELFNAFLDGGSEPTIESARHLDSWKMRRVAKNVG